MLIRYTIWTGGQTGVDRAALDIALETGMPYGGWVPKGRLAEDGTIPIKYNRLREAGSTEYAERTYLNVRDTDATLVLRWNAATGGTLYTLEVASELDRPVLEIDLAHSDSAFSTKKIVTWIEQLQTNSEVIRLNVAGPRASEAPDSYKKTKEILESVFRLLTANHRKR